MQQHERVTACGLTVSDEHKSIPYPPADRDYEGTKNYGFKCLKGRPELAATIPEAQDEPHMRRLLEVVNDSTTGLFTVGCEKAFNYDEEEQQHWAKGFIEFAFNSPLRVGAENYFSVFWQFNMAIRGDAFDERASFHWQLCRAQFEDAPGIDGTSCTVWIQTAGEDSEAETGRVWGACVDLLADVLGAVPPTPGPTIYRGGSDAGEPD